MSKSIKITRVVPTEDGGSKFVEDTRHLTHETTIGALSEREKVKDIIFRRTEGSYDLDFHTAPQRQYIVMLNGAVDVTTTDHETRRFADGDILLVEDTTGKGHKSKAVAGGVRTSLFVTLE
eukprot:jgi/Astpho2/5144/Aster-06355